MPNDGLKVKTPGFGDSLPIQVPVIDNDGAGQPKVGLAGSFALTYLYIRIPYALNQQT